jgi:YD repeat-containing protein
VSVSTPGVGGSPKAFSYVGGFLGGVTDEAGRATQFTPDPLNRVAAVTQSGRDRAGNPVSAAVASYAFAPYADQLAAVTDGSTRTTSYATDDFGRVTKMDSPTPGVGRGRWYQYGARGNLIAWGDAGTTATLTYDGLDRLVATDAQSATDGSTIHHEYRYDERGFAGQLTSRVEPGRTVTFTYDSGGRVLTESSLEPGIATSVTTAYA